MESSSFEEPTLRFLRILVASLFIVCVSLIATGLPCLQDLSSLATFTTWLRAESEPEYDHGNIISLVNRLLGREEPVPGSAKLPEPANLKEALDLLPKEVREWRRKERKWRAAAFFAFLVVVVGIGTPVWWVTTETSRASIPPPPAENALIRVTAQLFLAHTGEIGADLMPQLVSRLSIALADLSQTDPLRVDVDVQATGLKKIEELEKDFEGGGVLAADEGPEWTYDNVILRVAIVDSKDWPVFSGVNTFYGAGNWTLVNIGDLPEVIRDQTMEVQRLDRLVHRVQTAVVDVLLDVNHLVSIVKRDTKQMPTPGEIAAMPSSHQKRIVWDGASLSPKYHVHVVFAHENGRGSEAVKWAREGEQLLVDHVRTFAQLFEGVVDIEVSSEHLWDATPSWFSSKDVQARQAIDRQALDTLLASIDSVLGPVDGAAPLLRIVVLDPSERIFLLDQHGLAIASWGAVLDGFKVGDIRKDAWAREVASRAVAGLRVLLGLDAELPSTSSKSTVPLANWELQRLKIRAFVDDTSRATTSIRSLHRLLVEIPEMAVEEDVAANVREAVRTVSTALRLGYTEQGRIEVRKGREAADAALFAPSLLASLYFPYEQRMAVYLPLALPALVPVLTGIPHFVRFLLGREV